MYRLHAIILSFFFRTTKKSKLPTDDELDAKMTFVKMQMKDLDPDISYVINAKVKRFFKYRWKSLVKTILLFVCIIVLGATLEYEVVEPQILHRCDDTVLVYRNDSTMTLENFMKQIAYYESRYNPSANREGSEYWGLYQMGKNARIRGGYGDISKEVFERHPEIQHLCMINFLKSNRDAMKSYIEKYNGKIIDGVLVTESGILALCQLGCGATQSYLDRGVIPAQDAYGNSPRRLLMIGGYRLDDLNKKEYTFINFDGRIN